MENIDNISEAHRYLDNAKEILRDKAKKDGRYYLDRKYVRMAGNTAYSGVLIALDNLLGKKEKGKKSVEWYKKELASIDRSILTSFNRVYDTLHITMGYDGYLGVSTAKDGIEEAEIIINWVGERMGV